MSNEELIKLFGESWWNAIEPYFDKSYFLKLGKFIMQERGIRDVYPPQTLIFKAFHETPFNEVKVVLLGQDCYPAEGAACGLAFAISNEYPKIPYSLQCIKDEIERSFYNGLLVDFDYTLSNWTKQGVLLLNAALTVVKHKPESHLKEWSPFTKTIFRALQDKSNVVFLLLGNKAQEYETLISNKHPIIKGVHPAAGAYNPENNFIGSGVFSKVNEQLNAIGLKEIKW
jgi:uracil-DNA glycosylase